MSDCIHMKVCGVCGKCYVEPANCGCYEPRRGECRNIAGYEDSFLCSECGARLYDSRIDRSYLDDDGKRWYTTDLQGIGLHFCPSCGREVER